MKTTRKLPWDANGATYAYDANNNRICTGSQMGRRDSIPDDPETVRKLHLRRVPMVDYNCYDRGGAYWGQGHDPLWCAWGESDTEQVVLWFRAQDREHAKKIASVRFANVRFYR